MQGALLKIMILEDSPDDADLLVRKLRSCGLSFVSERIETEAEFLVRLETPPDLILSDYNMPLLHVPRALQTLQERQLDIPFIIVSGAIGEDLAVAALKSGADDYLLKDRLGRLHSAITHALEQRRIQKEKRRAEEALREAHAELENRVQQRTKELAIANRELVAEIQQRQRVEREIAAVSEREHERLGMELHDGLGQSLAGVVLMAKSLEDMLGKRKRDEAELAGRIGMLLTEAVGQAHNLAKAFYPVELEKNGLVRALEEFSHTIQSFYKVSCLVRCDSGCNTVSKDIEIHLYRIMQEAVRTAIRSCQAKQVWIEGTTNHRKHFVVAADGSPCARTPDPAAEMGFKIMQYRSKMIGAVLTADWAPQDCAIRFECEL